ncbi:MAG: cytochrome d ubiquinol oxidase subunit II [Coriobacteriales bacterium]|nr:cytochrome d ubiquinol oxidase subunit II [Coriobacteriales bacterium]
MSALGILWFFLIFLLIAGYFVLDGFDLGVGCLYPFIARTEGEKELLRASIAPVWDGNEVWLLTAGGALFAAFPAAYACTFSGFYLAIMLVLFGLIIRVVSLELHHSSDLHKVWDWGFFVGSALPALLLGVAVGNVFAGVPLAANGDYAGIPLLGLITPFTLICGLLGLAMFLAAGAGWIILKSPVDSELRARAVGLRKIFQIAALALFALATLWVFAFVKPQMAAGLGIVRVLLALLTVAALVAALLLGMKAPVGKAAADAPAAPGIMGACAGDLLPFILQSAAAIFLVFLCACSMFPNLVVASAGSVGASITVATAASGALTLKCMTIVACIGVPLVLFYHYLIYKSFRGRLELA